MSQSLVLVSYPSDESGRLFEEDSQTVQSAAITDSLLRRLENEQLFRAQVLFEEPGSAEFSEIKRVDDEKLDDLQRFLEQEFLALVSDTRQRTTEVVIAGELSSMIQEVGTVCNLYGLVELKKTRFPNSNAALKVS